MSQEHSTSCPSTPIRVEKVINRPGLEMSELKEISPCPMTPLSTGTIIHTTPQAPKKPMAKMLEFLKPTVYRPEDDSASSAPERVLDALSRAGVRKSLKPQKEDPPKKGSQKKGSQKKTYATPRKLTVHIVDGKTDAVIHQYVSIYLLMDISPKAREALESKPWAGRYKVYGKYSAAAMSGMLDALAHHLPIPISTTNLADNLLTYEASLRLGISRTNVLLIPLLSSIYMQISAGPIDSEVLAFVTYRLGAKDPVFMHMANVLCYQRFTKSVPDVKEFEKMVAKKPALQKAMRQIDQAHKARREAFKTSKQARCDAETDVSSRHFTLEIENKGPEQTIENLLEAAALEKKGDQEQKETLLNLFKNNGRELEGNKETEKGEKIDDTKALD